MKNSLFFLAVILSIVSFAQDGSPDLSYGDNGVVMSDIGTEGSNWINGFGRGANDRIIITGENYGSQTNNFIVAYLEDGSIDTSFGNNGILWAAGNNESYQGINILPDEKIILKSTIDNNYTIKRLFPNGALDLSFGTNGQIQPFSAGRYVKETIIDAENNLLVLGTFSGTNGKSIVIKKFDANGILDIAFGVNGTISHSFGNVSNLLLSSFIIKNDKIYIGVSVTENDLNTNYILKLLSNGAIDLDFGNNGIATIPMGEEFRTSFSIFQDGSFLVSGSYYDHFNEMTVRKVIKLFPDATPNGSFGSNGSVVGFEGGYIQENQKIILNSHFYDFEGGMTLAYSRFSPNGVRDYSFQFFSNFYNQIGSADLLALNSGKFLVIGSDIWYNGPQINIILQRFNNTPLAVPEFENQKTTIYPNPSKGIFTIKRNLNAEMNTYQITDMLGKVIVNGQLIETHSQIDLSSVQSGVYFLETSNNIFRLLKN